MIPIIINSRNRVTMLRQLVNWCKQVTDQIIILDNDSDYEPLLEYYKEIKTEVTVKFLKQNFGSVALYRSGENLNHPLFVYTDHDVLPRAECPLDVLEVFKDELLSSSFNKVGFGLEIRDLPDYYDLKQDVINWESKFWQRRHKDKFFIGMIGHTFALYHHSKPSWKYNKVVECLRTDYPYVARHLPWYVDSQNLDDEQKYYIKTATAVKENGAPYSSWCYGRGFFNKSKVKTFL